MSQPYLIEVIRLWIKREREEVHCWNSLVAEKEGGIQKTIQNIGISGAGNSGPEAGFDQVKSEIGDRRGNGPILGVE